MLKSPSISHKDLSQLALLVMQGLQTDGGHHKQFFLYQIAQKLGMAVEGVDEGIEP
jgi:hypothetical protein